MPQKQSKTKKKKERNKWSFRDFKPPGADWKGPGGIKRKSQKKKKGKK